MELATIIIAGISLVWIVGWGIYTRPRRKAKESTQGTMNIRPTREKIEYVEKFMDEASKHLGYIAGLDRETVKKGIAENPRLHTLAGQAGIYLSPELTDKVEKYSLDFFKALLNLDQPHRIPEDYFNSFKERLNQLKSLLRAEIS